MCKYCEQDSFGLTERVFETVEYLSDGEEAFAISAYIDNKSIGMNLSYGGTIIWAPAVRIKHCPMCGRKL